MENIQIPESLKNIARKLEAAFSDKSPQKVKYNHEEQVMSMTLDFADAQWYQMYGKAGLKDSSRYRYRLDQQKKTAYYLVEKIRVEWVVGVPTISLKADYFRGQTWGYASETSYGMKEDGTFGKLYSYRNDMSDNFKRMKSIFESEGWELKRDTSDWSVRIAIVMAVIGGCGAVFTLLVLSAMWLLK